jgi:hypothetical protein
MKDLPLFNPSREPERSFYDARVKVAWAKENIGYLKSVIDHWASENTAISIVPFGDGGSRVGVATTPIPAHVPLISGDIIFSLRSALDCCWMGLKRAVHPATKKGTLPRGLTREDVKGTLAKASLEGMFPGCDNFILDELRPFRDSGNSLWMGAQLDNWNKHNMLIISYRHTVIGELILLHKNGSKMIWKNCRFSGSEPYFRTLPGYALSGDPAIMSDVLLGHTEFDFSEPATTFIERLAEETHKSVELFISKFGANTPSPFD